MTFSKGGKLLVSIGRAGEGEEAQKARDQYRTREKETRSIHKSDNDQQANRQTETQSPQK